MKNIPAIVTAAQHAKMPLKQWVIETLGIVADPNYASIMVPQSTYSSLRRLSYGRGMPIDVLTAREDMADLIQFGIDNGRI